MFRRDFLLGIASLLSLNKSVVAWSNDTQLLTDAILLLDRTRFPILNRIPISVDDAIKGNPLSIVSECRISSKYVEFARKLKLSPNDHKLITILRSWDRISAQILAEDIVFQLYSMLINDILTNKDIPHYNLISPEDYIIRDLQDLVLELNYNKILVSKKLYLKLTGKGYINQLQQFCSVSGISFEVAYRIFPDNQLILFSEANKSQIYLKNIVVTKDKNTYKADVLFLHNLCCENYKVVDLSF